MKVHELAKTCGFTYYAGQEVEDREVCGAYCCDLLSWVIGRAEGNDALVTVMSNPNVMAVAVMADLPCVILTEGVRPDETALTKAMDNDIIVLSSQETTYKTAVKIYEALKQ